MAHAVVATKKLPPRVLRQCHNLMDGRSEHSDYTQHSPSRSPIRMDMEQSEPMRYGGVIRSIWSPARVGRYAERDFSRFPVRDPQESFRDSFLAFSLETAPTTGMIHLQGYGELKTKKSLTGALKVLKAALCQTVHVEMCRGSQEQNMAYLGKNNNTVYSAGKVCGAILFGTRYANK